MFTLDPRLAGDTVPVTRLALCEVRLTDEIAWPWLILVPMRPDTRELLDLTAEDRYRLVDEIALAERVLADLHSPDKLNVAALGNQVAQLHVHVIARRIGDAAWPQPVWGATARALHPPGEAAAAAARLAAAFAARSDADG
ncbi:MAG: HIT domain-containing protein [Alphaproteobacteria bacterium]|nr:HIT domain-containing protein [Alphaproteobacteria bacterium]